MDLSGKKVLVVTSTDNMISQFLIPHIQDMQKMGATVECACNETGFFFDMLKNDYGFTMHKLDIPRIPFTLKIFKAKKELVKLIKENNYDLIHCQQPVGGVLARLAGHICKVPVLYIAHGFHFFKGAPIQNKIIYKTIETAMAKKTDSLVTMNEEDFLAAKKLKAKKVYKINGIGVDLNIYKKEETDESLRKELKINSDDFVVLAVGELNENKNHQTLLNAFNQIKNSKIKLLICGQGHLKSKYESFLKENKMEDRVTFLGFRKDISKIYNLANVFVMLSLREGLPRSMMEAMSNGIPVICSNIRGCNDLIQENKGGILVQPKDFFATKNAIEKLYGDKNLCEEFGERNKEFVKNFSLDVVLKQMREIYKNL